MCCVTQDEMRAIEAANAARNAKNRIPPITDPMGRHWSQPDSSLIEIDDTHARMTAATFRQLAEYSCSQPTGVYPGKMWRRDAWVVLPGASDRHILCWYGNEDPEPTKYCSNHYRIISIIPS